MPYGKLPTLQWPLSLLGHVQRYFRRNEGSTNYATIPAVTLAGDQRWEFYLLTKMSSGVGIIISGQSSVDRWYVAVENGKPLIGNGTDRVAGITIVNDGLFHHWVFEVVSNILTITVDGIVQYSDTVKATLPKAITNLMSDEGDAFILSGILANLKIYDNGTLVRDYPLNDNSNILANRAASLGSNAFSGFDTLGAGCTDEGGGVYSWDGTQEADSYSVKPLGVVFGSTQLITFTAEVVSGAVGPSMGVGGVRVSESGTYTQLIPVTNTTNISFGANASFVGSVSNISIRQADGYGTVINGNASDWGLFDRQANGDWLGQELVVNGGFDSADGWTLGGNWDIAGGEAIANEVSNTLLYRSINATGGMYLESLEVTSYTSGRIQISSGGAGSARDSVGVYSEERLSSGDSLIRLAPSFSSGFIGAIDNVSVKEVLKNA